MRLGNRARQGTKHNHLEANHFAVKGSVALYEHTRGFLSQTKSLHHCIKHSYSLHGGTNLILRFRSIVAESWIGIMPPLCMGRQLQGRDIGKDSCPVEK